LRPRSTTELGLASIAVLFAAACSKPAGPVDQGAGSARDPEVSNTVDPQEPSMTTIRDGAGIKSHDGEVVQLVGKYSVTSTGGHKIMYTLPDGTTGSSNQFVQLGLEGGVWVKIGVRPDEEMAQLKGKTVMATGKLIASPERKGQGAQPDPQPTLVQVTSVVEAP
jgi:hypothetical protein